MEDTGVKVTAEEAGAIPEIKYECKLIKFKPAFVT